MFVHAFDRVDRIKYTNPSERIGEALGTIGPSILLTSLAESCCFGIGIMKALFSPDNVLNYNCLLPGSLSNMPAVKTFALFSTAAILLNLIFQVTVFVALMSLDQKRVDVLHFSICLPYTNVS